MKIVETIKLSYEWLYDVLIVKHIQTDSYRQVILAELDKIQPKLKQYNQAVTCALDKLNSTEQNILKRLEWASGSNPSLIEVTKVFETQRKKRNDYFKVNFF